MKCAGYQYCCPGTPCDHNEHCEVPKLSADGKRCPMCPRPNCHDCPVEHGEYIWIDEASEIPEHVWASCPAAPMKQVRWQRDPAAPGFYKLDTSNG